ncbi:TadE/TadG family type IV pilus assembly protein [Methylobacterium sp. WL120]|uniref:TadE/TadG family type IV pilus assembly protein n=1 Tax=Methylobacterium sp. WL120 TaxID=2603887 RepID=UPI0011C9FEEC|nr:TadE/TadG family type IV pilus assembly protein [Methylobacterium sp. WL120]TXM64318.1 von willebrand factor type a [Methylobacterium sp. WL120]
MPVIPTSAGRKASLRGQAGRFARARDGNVALLFGLMALPLLGFTGAAIDYGFATYLETKLQAATDASALALCQTPMATTNAVLQTQASTMMTGYMGATGLTVDPLTVTANPRQITLTTHIVSPVFFGRITGVTAPRPGGSARCATPIPKTFEIALVLDNTGSMLESSGGQSKLQAVQTAATNFVNYVYTNAAFATGTKIAIVPFAASVALNPTTYRYATWIDQNAKSSYHWDNVLSPSGAGFTNRFDIFTKLQAAYSGWGWGGCLETLPYPLNVQDGTPSSSNADSYYVPMFAPDEPGNGGTGYRDYNSSRSYNSYIDDSTYSASCQSQSNASFFDAEGRACKYVNPKNASPTNSNSSTKVPNGPNFGCTTQPLQRLTSDTSVLKTTINGMAALGSTNIHEGMMWGWRTLSPISVFADGAAYSSNTVNKIIILMTDGANSWATNGSSSNGSLYFAAGYLKNVDGTGPASRLVPGTPTVNDADSARDAVDALTALACKNAKATGISIYTIGFSIPSDPIDTQGLKLLSDCATTASQSFVANDSSSLIGAFNQIAASIGTLRLTQ